MVSRRLLLTSTGTTLAASISGCSDILGEDDDANGENLTDDGNSTGNGNETTNHDQENGGENGEANQSNPAYTDWLAADIVGDQWSVVSKRPSKRADIDAISNAGEFDDFEGIDDSDVDLVTFIGGYGGTTDTGIFTVYEGSFDSQTILTAIETREDIGTPVEAGAYQNFDLYHGEGMGGEPLFGIRDSVMVFGFDRTTLEAGIDAKRGDAPRLQTVDQRFQRIAAALSVDDSVELLAQEHLGDVPFAHGYEYAPEESTFELVVLQPDEQEASSLAELLETQELAFTDPTVTVDGSLVTFTAGVATARIDGFDPGSTLRHWVVTKLVSGNLTPDSPQQPLVRFDFDYDSQADTLTVGHMSGDSFTAGAVRFEGTGSPDIGSTWADLSTGEDITAESEIGAGDIVQLDGVEPDCEIDIIWNGEDSNSTAVIGEYRGPKL